ncbi:MAG: Ribosomal RNA small subunit methyltransferase I [Candidatus Wolfebacteria bacterium GW2011_GWC1_43_10]|uniref:Ribosomal RNA small subunit methyltransferase I n=2 Tax=Candidatus Wolfeibacteriota TaxID=1752735 RepID=A0A0G1CAM2_9BACT|nr:MAG: Ribosomal RNA small subunit methyltransferase I [Candidatus Wolfebacteria bacterium GW2011_GWC1_43_10]KKT22915.1 MAG: Ribosomal RNA small subunit methyltransferase I [Parcubacteria group bacterium GW2011_GWB1_43_8b]
MLFIVSTPIGNLKDISRRALETLRDVDVIIAESPVDSLRLLNAYKISGKEIIKYNDRNKKSALKVILDILKEKNAAYITSAGTPSISDPGGDLVRGAREKGIGINVIPGPSALISAIAASGIRAREFTFVSFPPKKQGQLKNLFNKFKKGEGVLVFFESPFRILKTLGALKEVAPECYLCVAKEMTKMFENYFTGIPEEVIKKLEEKKENQKGEFTIIVQF